MAEFGYHTIGAVWANHIPGAFRCGGVAFSPADDGVLDSISVYGRAGGVDITIKLGLYDSADDSFAGGTVESLAFGTIEDWHTAAADGVVHVYAAKIYYIACKQSANQYVYYDDSGGPNDKYVVDAYGNPWPGTAVWTNDGTKKFSMFATYTPGGAPPPSSRALVIGRPPGVYSTKQCITRDFVYI